MHPSNRLFPCLHAYLKQLTMPTWKNFIEKLSYKWSSEDILHPHKLKHLTYLLVSGELIKESSIFPFFSCAGVLHR